MALHSIWSGAVPPDGDPTHASDSALSVGTKFTVSEASYATAVRFYFGSTWSSGGAYNITVGLYVAGNETPLATATWNGVPPVGWTDVPIALTALAVGTTYIATVHYAQGAYPVRRGYFTSPRTSGIITAPVTAGVYAYGAALAYPGSDFDNSAYYSDAVVDTDPVLPGEVLKEGGASAGTVGGGTPTVGESSYTLWQEEVPPALNLQRAYDNPLTVATVIDVSSTVTAMAVLYYLHDNSVASQNNQRPLKVAIFADGGTTPLVVADTTPVEVAEARWVQVSIPPLELTPGRYSIAAHYFVTDGPNDWAQYAAVPGYFTGSYQPIVRGSISAPHADTPGGNGRFEYGAALAYPASTFNGGGYFIDVLVEEGGAAEPVVVDKTGGAASTLSADGTRTVAIATAGGGSATANSGGVRRTALHRSGIGVAEAAGGGVRSLLSSRVGGASGAASGGATRLIAASRQGGGSSMARAGAPRSVVIAKAGGAQAAAQGGGGTLTAMVHAAQGGALAGTAAGGTRRAARITAGGAASAVSAGAVASVTVSKSGGAMATATAAGARLIEVSKAGGAGAGGRGGADDLASFTDGGAFATATAGGRVSIVLARSGGASASALGSEYGSWLAQIDRLSQPYHVALDVTATRAVLVTMVRSARLDPAVTSVVLDEIPGAVLLLRG